MNWKELIEDNKDMIYEMTKRAIFDSAMNIMRELDDPNSESDERRRLVVISDSGKIDIILTDANYGPGYFIDDSHMVVVHVSNLNRRNGGVAAAAIVNSIEEFTEHSVNSSIAIIKNNMQK